MVYKINGNLVADENGYVHESFTQQTGTIASTQTSYISSTTGELFGRSIAIGDGVIVVGAPLHNGGIGRIYIFDYDGNLITNVVPFDGAGVDNFGEAVAVADGRIAVGSLADDDNGFSNSGSVYIYDLQGSFIQKITASDPGTNHYFGSSVAMGNGRIVVGSYGQNAAYIFDRDGNELKKLTPDETGLYFGRSVAIGCGRIVVGMFGADPNQSGSAYIYSLDGQKIKRITSSDVAWSDNFGSGVAAGSGKIVVTAPGDLSFNGSAYIFDIDGNELTKISSANAPGPSQDAFGNRSAAISSNRIAIGARSDGTFRIQGGAMHIFDLAGNFIEKIIFDLGTNYTYYGRPAVINDDIIVVGAEGSSNNVGRIYIYKISETYSSYIEKVSN